MMLSLSLMCNIFCNVYTRDLILQLLLSIDSVGEKWKSIDVVHFCV